MTNTHTQIIGEFQVGPHNLLAFKTWKLNLSWPWRNPSQDAADTSNVTKINIHVTVELSFNSRRLLIKSWSPAHFHWLFWMQYQFFFSTSGACSEVMFEVE